MTNRSARVITLITALSAASLLAGGAPGLSASPSPQVAGGAPVSNVHELVTFIPPTAQSVAFTDWGRIRAAEDATDVTGDSPMEDKLRVLMTTAHDEAAASGFGLAHVQRQRDAWGWDTMDLDWEATIGGDGPPLFVLRFRDGFDLAPVEARFDARGFTTDERDGGTVHSHAMDMSEDWLTATEFAILNTAFLDDGRTLVLSVDEEAVDAVVDDHGRFPTLPGVAATAETLDGASALMLLPGLGSCVGFVPLPIQLGDPVPSVVPSRAPSGLHPYAALGIGYAHGGWDPVGRISFGYLDPASATADQDGRAAEAREGISIRARAPYSEVVFGVQDARVDDSNVVLDVTPANDIPTRLFQMVLARDMTFAGC